MHRPFEDVLRKTLMVGGLYFAVTLLFFFFCGSAAAGSAGMADLSPLELGMAVLQPVAAFIAWLGTKRPAIHQRVTLEHLALISCAWSFAVGYGYALLTVKKSRNG
jgi:hypothetical protein